MNKVILRGNVGQEVRTRTFDGGGKMATFSLATTERGYETRDGRKIPDVTEWHNIVVRHSGLAGVCERYVTKGTAMLVVGKIRTREYSQDGQTRRVTEILAEEIELLGSKQTAYKAVDDDMPC